MLNMKRLVLLSLLLFPIFLFAQYPTFSNKQKLGVQTTGDGLIFRGNEQTPSYTPNNVNNAYFYLDTVRNTLKFYKTNQWFTIYPTASDTISLGAYLLKSDTLAMLLPYLRKTDTISLSNRINNKLSLADTASMLAPYLKLADTTSMLAPYFRDSDTTMLNLNARFNSKLNATDTVSLSNRINLKLNQTDTINLSNRIDLKLNKSDTISLSNRIDIKLNPSDTVSLSNRINTKLNTSDTINLSNRINKKLDTLYVNYQTSVDLLTNKDTININTLEAGAGINIVNNVISLDTTLLDSVVRVQNVYVKNGTGTVLNKGEAVYVTGANGTNIIVGRASNVAESTSSKTLGLTMTSIGVNGFGYVIKEGLLAGLNTNSAIDGDPIWLGVNGGLIFGLANKPFAPKHLVYLGIVTRKQQNNGEVYVTVQNGFEIKELHDVQITDPVNKASLYYNSSESLWRDTTATLLVSDTASMLSKYVNTYSNQTNINGEKSFNNNINIPSYNLGTFTSEKSFNVLFNNDANQKVRLYFPANSRLQGGYEITLSSGFYFVQASGMLRKSYGVQLQENGTLYFQSTHVPYVLGAIGNHFTISNFEYDSQTNTWGVIIACLSSNASNYVHINIKSYINPENLSTWLNARASSANITNIYTTNTTVYPNLNPTNLSKSDTASMLLSYVNTYGNQININGNKTFNNVVTIDSATITGKLLVNTSISDAVKINSNTNSTNLELANSSGSSVYIKSSNKNMILQTDTTALVYLNGDNKKVGILTMTPQQELEVNGNARITGLNNNLVPTNLVGSSNNNDLTNVHLGEGLSFTNDTLKVDLTIIDTAIAASSITLVGNVSGTGSTNSTVNTTINNGVVTNDMLAGGISDSKLNTITTSGKISNSATTATSNNTNNAIVTRDGSGNFTANNITATLTGNASTATNVAYSGLTGAVPIWNQNTTGNAATVTSVTPSNFASQTANTVLAAPNGSSGIPSFRSLVSTDIPNLNYLPLTGGTLTGDLRISKSSNSILRLSSSDVGSYGKIIFNSNTPGFEANGASIESSGDGVGVDVGSLNFLTGLGTARTTRMTITPLGNISILNSATIGGTLGVTSNITANSFVKSGGTSSQFLKADGSVDANTYLTTGTASSTYLPLTGGTLSKTTVYPSSDTILTKFFIKSGANNFIPTYGIFATFANSGGTNGTTYAGYFSNNATVDGNNYGLFVNTSNKGDYGIYQTGTGINYFGSNSTFAGNITGNSFIKSNGLSTEFLKANGTVDNNTYLTTTVAANTYLPLTGGTVSGSILNSWSFSPALAPRNDGAVRRTFTNNLRSANNNTTDRVTHYYTFSQDECCPGAPVTMYYGRFNGFYNQANIIYDASIYYHNTNQFYYRAFSEAENKVTFSIKPSTTINSISGTKADLYLSGDAQIDRSLNIGTTLGVSGVTTLSNLSGGSTRMVTASTTGVLSTQAIPTGTLVGTDTVSLSNRINNKVSLSGNETIAGTKTFLNLVNITNQMTISGSVEGTNKLLGKNTTTNGVGDITLGSGLSLASNVLNVSNRITDINTSQYSITSNDLYIDNFNNSSTTIILPLAGLNTYRELKFKNSSNGAVIANGNIIPLSGSGTTTTILPATNAKWCTLVSDGAFWRIMQSN
jgi:hypothetical protein